MFGSKEVKSLDLITKGRLNKQKDETSVARPNWTRYNSKINPKREIK